VINEVKLEGIISKTQVLRGTKKGIAVYDFKLAVPRPNGIKDSIPIVCFDEMADRVSRYPIGTKISILGRLQSRQFKKRNEEVIRTAFEVSASKIDLMETVNLNVLFEEEVDQ
jgi:single-stranded DNA-binding protein